MPDPYLINRDVEADVHWRGFLTKLEIAEMCGKQVAEEYRQRIAQSLLECGLTLIPSDHLQDHQFVVSRGVYKAALEVIKSAPARWSEFTPHL